MRHLLFGIVFVSPPFVKKLILKWFCGAQFGRKATICWFSSVIGRRVVLGDYSTVKPLTLIRCDGEVSIAHYSEVSSFSVIYGCANFRIGDKCYIGPQTWINVTEDVLMGNGVGIGPRTMIFTHGSFLPYTEGYPVRFGKVILGNRVWIPAGVFIQPGIEVGDDVLVNSRSVLTKSLPSGQYVAGFPAKPIRPLEEIRQAPTPAGKDALILHVLKHFISFLQQTTRGIAVTDLRQDVTLLRSQGRNYLIMLVNSEGITPVDLEKYRDRQVIVLLNFAEWSLPGARRKMLVFDFTRMRTAYSRDRLHGKLFRFMKMYYGVFFEYGQS